MSNTYSKFEQEIATFRRDQKTLTRKCQWDHWFDLARIEAPGDFVVQPGINAYDVMRMSVASGYGWAWIPTPPDRQPAAWRRTCFKFNKEANNARFDRPSKL